MGFIKIKDKWSIEYYIEYYDETGRRKRRVIEKDGEKPEKGWYEETKKAYRAAKAAIDKGEPLPFAVSKKTFAENGREILGNVQGDVGTRRSGQGSRDAGPSSSAVLRQDETGEDPACSH